MHACVATWVIDTMYHLIYTSAQTQTWRIEKCIKIFANIWRGKIDEPERLSLELALKTAPNICAYFDSKIRFLTHAICAL